MPTTLAAGAALNATYSSAIGANIDRIFYQVGPVSAGRTPKFEQASIVKQLKAADASPQAIIAAAGAGQYQFWVQDIDRTSGLASGFSVFNSIVS
jgi:hypothetical protein